jgi:hypothetical protein
MIKHQIVCFVFAFSAPPRHFLARTVVREVRPMPGLLPPSGRDWINFGRSQSHIQNKVSFSHKCFYTGHRTANVDTHEFGMSLGVVRKEDGQAVGGGVFFEVRLAE